ncbi:MAG TPA: AraC family transcriptional regulator, partial [Candidatus Nitrosocosmicus sp.]|nr:AraC family transcriptional regulator [Candidatus Nitrosocosmicus sp.]
TTLGVKLGWRAAGGTILVHGCEATRIVPPLPSRRLESARQNSKMGCAESSAGQVTWRGGFMIPMMNTYETIRTTLHFNKFVVGELLFVEYKCPIEQEAAGVWTPMDYFVHVLSGKKTWRTTDGTWIAEKGQTLFFKKGAAVVYQDFKDDFCVLVFFVSDNFIRDVVREVSGQLSGQRDANVLQKAAILINGGVTLAAYFQSMLTYFTGTIKPAETLLTLKLKELIVSVLLGGRNCELASYFQSLLKTDAPVLSQIMEANFSYNLALEDFARLSHHSLSTFKRDFRKYYNQSPGKWLLQKRLDYSAVLLKNPALNVSQVALDCGFEDLSHFSRAFKEKFGTSPAHYRKETPGRGDSQLREADLL